MENYNEFETSSPRHRPSVRVKQQQGGFTILEVLTVLTVGSILGMMTIPSFQSAIREAQLEGVAKNAAAVLQRAKSEASKRGVPVVVVADFSSPEESDLLVFADYHDADSGSSGSDLVYTEGSEDRLITRWPVVAGGQLKVDFWSPLDDQPRGAHAIDGFVPAPGGEALPPIVVFNGSTVEALGSMSFGLSNAKGDELLDCRTVRVCMLSGATEILACDEAV